MKLAEALLNRGTLQSKINELRTRLSNNAVVQEGESPAESPRELLSQMNAAFAELETLMTKINLTNASLVYEGRTMTQMLAQRECLRDKLSAYRSFLNEASMTGRRSRGSEIKIISTVPVADIQKDIDKKSQELRKLEIKIQELNWITDLKED